MSEHITDTPAGPTAEYDALAWCFMRDQWSSGVPGFASGETESDRGLDDWEIDERNAQRQNERIAGRLALDNPNLDYFTKSIPKQPKREIGAYVLSHGFNVPLIQSQDEWRSALSEGTAMLRSEMEQDYSGTAGLLGSRVVGVGNHEQLVLYGAEKLITQGMHSGEVSDREYIENMRWNKSAQYYYKQLAEFRVPLEYWPGVWAGYLHGEVSRWRYVEGLNIDVFRDPSVAGRYYIATRSDHSKWSDRVDIADYDEPVVGRHQLPLAAGEVIEYYETIRSLPLFDTTNAPVMELQMDTSGELHFLQYHKTPHSVDEVELFTLPAEGIRLEYVRGTTLPEGITRRLYVHIDHFSESIVGQACYISQPEVPELMQALLSSLCDVVMTDWGTNLRGSHGNKSALYKPKLTLTSRWSELGEVISNLQFSLSRAEGSHNYYIDMHVVSNGREAMFASDFEVKYDD